MKILILSVKPKSYSTEKILNAAAKRGHAPIIIPPYEFPIYSSKNQIYYEFDAIIPRIGVPLSKYGATLLQAFENHNVFSTTSSLGLEVSRDKLKTALTLEESNIATPKTVSIGSISHINSIVDYLGGFPVVLKLLQSSQGRGVSIIRDYSQLFETARTLIYLKQPFLVQEFVKEAGGSDLRCFVVDGKVVGAMMRTAAEGDFRSNVHQGGSVKKVRLSKDERRTAIKAARILKLNVAGVDILRSNDGPKILEVNSSPGLEGIEKATGKDIAGEIINCIESNVRTVFRTARK